MSKQIKNTTGVAGLTFESHTLTHGEIKKLESCIDKLVETTNRLTLEMSSTRDKLHFMRCAKAIQSNIESIHKLTLSTHSIKLQERKAGEKDVTPNGWELL